MTAAPGGTLVENASGFRADKLEGMRRTIANRLQESLQTMAQVTLQSEADVTPLVRLHEGLKDQGITYSHLLIKAVALSLRQHRSLNACLVHDEIRIYDAINIGFAVSLSRGLVVPVISGADGKSLEQIAAEVDDLTGKAHSGKLSIAEVTQGTFTISNMGMFPIDHFTPIINPPQVAILGIGRLRRGLSPTAGTDAAAGTDGTSGTASDAIRLTTLLPLSLTFDHRAIDGAAGARFLQTLTATLRSPADLTP